MSDEMTFAVRVRDNALRFWQAALDLRIAADEASGPYRSIYSAGAR